MSTTLIECDDKPVLDGFCAAIKFFAEDAELSRGKGFVVIETDDDWADMTYRLDRKGLTVVKQGASL